MPSPATAVLIDLPADRLPAVAGDIRRLARQPLWLRWLPTGDDEPGRVLVRVEAAPVILIERISAFGCVYTEASPNIWVRLGQTAVTAGLPADQLVLVGPDGSELIPPGEFVCEIDSLELPSASDAGAAGSPAPTVEVRLRLVGGTEQGPPRLWVLRDDALGQLTAYCRITHQQLLGRYAVAVSAAAGVPCAVLKVLTTKGPPPVFVGVATAYVQLLKLPNVFLPAGMRLIPGLRRDALRKALAVRDDRVLWLHPLGGGGFQLESLPDTAFRPLADWVDFRVPEVISAGRTWTQSRRWEFEPFVEVVPRTKPEHKRVSESAAPRAEVERPGFRARVFDWLGRFRSTGPGATELAAPVEPNIPVGEAVHTALDQGNRLHHARPEGVSQAIERSQSLEARFLHELPAGSGEVDPDRWAELAAAFDPAGNHADAALCWLNGLWGQSRPSPLWAWGWLRSEARAAKPEVRVIDPGPWLASTPGPGTTRAMAAWVVWASLQSPTPAVLAGHSADLQIRLTAHEHWLPVRAAWLAQSALARAGRGDVLALARTRDRLSERLHASGLNLELDTPSFLRFAGEGVRERFHEARRWLADRRDLIRDWLTGRSQDARVRADPADGPSPLRQVGLEPDVAHTRAYADLILAWGLSRFAEHATAERVRREGAGALPADDPVHAALRDGFDFRIRQVRDGKPPRGPLPPEILSRIGGLSGIPRYAVDKLREHSRVLEPTARVDGYWESIFRLATPASPANRIAGLPPDRLDSDLVAMLEFENARPGRPHLPAVVAAALERAAEVADGTVDAVAAALPGALDAADPRVRARLIELGMDAAARWDRADVARELTRWFLQLSDGPGWEPIDRLTRPSVRALRRVGLPAIADRVLDHVALRVHRGQPLGRIRSERPADWPAGLRVLLRAAGEWYASGRDEPAHEVIEEARRDLFARDTLPRDRTDLAFAYAAAVGQAPVRVALGRLEELFQRLAGIQVVGSTNAYYTLKPLMLVETAVRAVVSDDFALGPQARAWLDADELAVRRRIRDDLRTVLAAQGL